MNKIFSCEKGALEGLVCLSVCLFKKSIKSLFNVKIILTRHIIPESNNFLKPAIASVHLELDLELILRLEREIKVHKRI